MVPKPNEKKDIVLEMHMEIGHFGEQWTLAKICKQYYSHNRTEQIRAIVKACKECQQVRQTGSIRPNVEDLKYIPICDLFYKITLDTTRPTRETNIFLLPLTITLNGVKQKLY
jgi:hypothetical protein